jgi:hypothetical protein
LTPSSQPFQADTQEAGEIQHPSVLQFQKAPSLLQAREQSRQGMAQERTLQLKAAWCLVEIQHEILFRRRLGQDGHQSWNPVQFDPGAQFPQLGQEHGDGLATLDAPGQRRPQRFRTAGQEGQHLLHPLELEPQIPPPQIARGRLSGDREQETSAGQRQGQSWAGLHAQTQIQPLATTPGPYPEGAVQAPLWGQGDREQIGQ